MEVFRINFGGIYESFINHKFKKASEAFGGILTALN